MSRLNSLSEVIKYDLSKEDEEDIVGWDKLTVNYAITHKERISSYIKSFLFNKGELSANFDVEDIYMMLIEDLYKSCDYDLDLAYQRSKVPGSVVPVEGYVLSRVKYCVMRWIKKHRDEAKHTISESKIKQDESYISLFDLSPDNGNIDAVIDNQDLDTICKEHEYLRYRFGIDLFQIWFIRLCTIAYRKEDKYNDIIEVLGVTKKDVERFEDKTFKDEVMINIAKAITRIDMGSALYILSKYTYASNKIRMVIEMV